MTPEELDEYDRIGYMTFSEREARALIAEVRRLNGVVASYDTTMHEMMQDAASTAREAERERCLDWVAARAMDCGCSGWIADKIREGK